MFGKYLRKYCIVVIEGGGGFLLICVIGEYTDLLICNELMFLLYNNEIIATDCGWPIYTHLRNDGVIASVCYINDVRSLRYGVLSFYCG